MATLHAFEYAMGIYGLSIVVTLFVWAVIVAIRWASSDRGSRVKAPKLPY